ncbi:MAG: DUF177 domain-containing protein [Alphaproteobacteria bacterium]|nr:DUF177 domain-containing protein [Alphaproteobacteria bacterium]
MPKDVPGPDFSHVVEVDRIGPQGLQMQLEADQAARVALARQLRILGVLSLKADLKLVPEAKAGHFRLTGQIEAEVEQACVVTLEPVRQQVSEGFVRRFGPETEVRPEAELGEDEAEWLDPDADDPPDPVIGGQINLGEVVAEELALGLDPYPRKPGAEVPDTYREAAEEGAKISPFAALAKLKATKKD